MSQIRHERGQCQQNLVLGYKPCIYCQHRLSATKIRRFMQVTFVIVRRTRCRFTTEVQVTVGCVNCDQNLASFKHIHFCRGQGETGGASEERKSTVLSREHESRSMEKRCLRYSSKTPLNLWVGAVFCRLRPLDTKVCFPRPHNVSQKADVLVVRFGKSWPARSRSKVGPQRIEMASF